MLLYSMLHLAGFDLPLEEFKRFRQWGSKTPGHPESFHTVGVELTTGPLGQGISSAVGIAASMKMLGARFNESGRTISSGRVFGLASDGDIMEGISREAGSLAGHLGLDNVIFFYDDNHITIDGETELAFSEDVGKRYEAYGWFVQHIDGHNHAQIRAALDAAVAEPARPSLIVARTHIAARTRKTVRRPTARPSAPLPSRQPRRKWAGRSSPRSWFPTRSARFSRSAPKTRERARCLEEERRRASQGRRRRARRP